MHKTHEIISIDCFEVNRSALKGVSTPAAVIEGRTLAPCAHGARIRATHTSERRKLQSAKLSTKRKFPFIYPKPRLRRTHFLYSLVEQETSFFFWFGP